MTRGEPPDHVTPLALRLAQVVRYLFVFGVSGVFGVCLLLFSVAHHLPLHAVTGIFPAFCSVFFFALPLLRHFSLFFVPCLYCIHKKNEDCVQCDRHLICTLPAKIDSHTDKNGNLSHATFLFSQFNDNEKLKVT